MMKEQYKVMDGAESFFIKGNEVGILISHGFMGTPQSMEYVAHRLAEQGYTVYAARLKGHGTHHYDLEKCTYKDWVASIEEGYKKLKAQCSKVFMLGQSMGGTLTANLALTHKDIDGIMLINPAINSIPEMEHLDQTVNDRFVEEGRPDIHNEEAVEITYTHAPMKAIRELLSFMKVVSFKLSAIEAPLLCLTSPEDHVVPASNSTYLLNHVSSQDKKQVMLPNSYHVASMDFDQDTIVKQCTSFIESNLQKFNNVMPLRAAK